MPTNSVCACALTGSSEESIQDETPPAPIRLCEDDSGRLSLPRRVFELILSGLPVALQTAYNSVRQNGHDNELVTLQGEEVQFFCRDTGRVVHLLKQHSVRTDWRRSFTNPNLEAPCETRAGLHDRPWVPTNVYRNVRYGQFVALDDSMRWDLIAETIEAFPQAPVMVVVKNREQAQTALRELGQRVTRPIQPYWGTQRDAWFPVLVTNPQAARTVNQGNRMLLLPYPYPGVPSWLRDILRWPVLDRIYMFRTVDEYLSRNDAEQLSVALDLKSLDLPSFLRGRARYTFLNFGGNGSGSNLQVAQLEKRKFYWRNDHRNRLVASMALVYYNSLTTRSSGQERTVMLVLTESLEHARRIHNLLPEWTFIDNHPLENGQQDRFILTWHGLLSTNIRNKTITVIYASGGCPNDTVIAALQNLLYRCERLNILDINDQFNRLVSRASEHRKESYRQQLYGCQASPKTAIVSEIWRQVDEF